MNTKNLLKKFLFYLFIILSFFELILNTLKTFFNIDIIKNNTKLAKYVYFLQNSPITLKILLIIIYFIIIIFLYKNFSTYLDNIDK